MKKADLVTTAIAVAMLFVPFAATSTHAREYVSIVGSSTVYPFTTVVAERVGRKSGLSTPKVEATGTGGGMKLFCGGIGAKFPDAINASRQIKPSELEACKSNGVQNVIEVKVGYDGMVIANSREGVKFELNLREIFLALAKNVPDAEGNLVPNPYTHWNQISPRLPNQKIEVLGPPPTSGTRDALVELAMEGGAKTFEFIAALEEQQHEEFIAIAHSIREDGMFIEAGENDNLIVQKLQADPNVLGIFGYSFLDQNYDQVQGSIIDGVEPEFEAIYSGDYSVSRPLYLYVKAAHVDVIPGMNEFLKEYTSENAWGDEGYLSDKGLIPMPETERDQYADAVENLVPL